MYARVCQASSPRETGAKLWKDKSRPGIVSVTNIVIIAVNCAGYSQPTPTVSALIQYLNYVSINRSFHMNVTAFFIHLIRCGFSYTPRTEITVSWLWWLLLTVIRIIINIIWMSHSGLRRFQIFLFLSFILPTSLSFFPMFSFPFSVHKAPFLVLHYSWKPLDFLIYSIYMGFYSPGIGYFQFCRWLCWSHILWR